MIMFAYPGTDTQALFALKVLRVARLVRITTGDLFTDLRMMVYSMYRTLSTLFWFLVLMTLLTYCIALCLTRGVVDYAIDELGEGGDWQNDFDSDGAPSHVHEMILQFGTVPR